MRIYISMVGCGNKIYKVDTIRHGGKIWLVPEWFEVVGHGYMIPERILRMDHLSHQVGAFAGSDFVLNEPIPEEALYKEPTVIQVALYEMQRQPDIRVQIGNA